HISLAWRDRPCPCLHHCFLGVSYWPLGNCRCHSAAPGYQQRVVVGAERHRLTRLWHRASRLAGGWGASPHLAYRRVRRRVRCTSARAGVPTARDQPAPSTASYCLTPLSASTGHHLAFRAS